MLQKKPQARLKCIIALLAVSALLCAFSGPATSYAQAALQWLASDPSFSCSEGFRYDMRISGASACLAADKRTGATPLRLVIDMTDHDKYNLNHYFRQAVLPVGVWCSHCLAHRLPLDVCDLSAIESTHFLRSSSDYTTQEVSYITHMMLEKVCKRIVWDKSNDSSSSSNNNGRYCDIRISNRKQRNMRVFKLKGVSTAWKQEALQLIRAGVLEGAGLSAAAADGGKKRVVLYDRGDASHGRKLLNAAQVIAQLKEAFPLYVVRLVSSLEALQASGIVKLFSETDIFIAPHGAWMPNAIFMPAGASVYVIENIELRDPVDTFVFWDSLYDETRFARVRLLTNRSALLHYNYQTRATTARSDFVHIGVQGVWQRPVALVAAPQLNPASSCPFLHSNNATVQALAYGVCNTQVYSLQNLMRDIKSAYP